MTIMARGNNISINTEQRLMGLCSHKFSSSYDYLPKHLVFEKFKDVDRTLHFICINSERHEMGQIFRTCYKSNYCLFQRVFFYCFEKRQNYF